MKRLTDEEKKKRQFGRDVQAFKAMMAALGQKDWDIRPDDQEPELFAIGVAGKGPFQEVFYLYEFDAKPENTRKSIKQVQPDETVKKWMLQGITYDPGVMYHKDGSGTPPSTDVEDIEDSASPRLLDVLRYAVNLWVKDCINGVLESEQWSHFAEDEEELEQEIMEQERADNP